MNHQIKFRASLLILILLVSAVVIFIWSSPRFLDKNASYTAYIYKDGKLLQTIDLSSIRSETDFVIGLPEKDYNTISVMPGCIGIAKASCPDQICVHQGYISTPLVPITCLPNHLVIELKASSTPDAVTY